MPPRPTLTGTVFLLTTVAIFLLLRRPLSAILHGCSSTLLGTSRSLSTRLADEESRYALFLQDRMELIKKWGPTANDIKPFPQREKSYTLWDFFIPAFQCPHRVERVGTLGDGGKWVCGLDRVAKQDKCVIYSFGINNESSFESTLLKRAPSCEVWGYDYSVNSWGPEITGDPYLRERAHFYPFALSSIDQHAENDTTKFWTLDSLMNLNGHKFIDILKIDVEGSEFNALSSFLSAHDNKVAFPVGQLQLEIHATQGHENFSYIFHWWESLEKAGLRPFYSETNLIFITFVRAIVPAVSEYSFINIRGDHALVNEGFD